MVDTRDLKSLASACRFESGRGYQKTLHVQRHAEPGATRAKALTLQRKNKPCNTCEVVAYRMKERETSMKDGWDYSEYLNFLNHLLLEIWLDDNYQAFVLNSNPEIDNV